MLLQNPIYFGSLKVKGYCHKVTLLIKYEGRSQKFLYCLVHGFHAIPLAVLQLFQQASRYGYNVSLSQQKVTYKVLFSLFMQMQQALSSSIVHAGGFIHQRIHVLGIVRIFKAVVTDSRQSHSAYYSVHLVLWCCCLSHCSLAVDSFLSKHQFGLYSPMHFLLLQVRCAAFTTTYHLTSMIYCLFLRLFLLHLFTMSSASIP